MIRPISPLKRSKLYMNSLNLSSIGTRPLINLTSDLELHPEEQNQTKEFPSWFEIIPEGCLLTRRAQHFSFSYNSCMYVFGGYDIAGDVQDTMFRLVLRGECYEWKQIIYKQGSCNAPSMKCVK